ncbi:hypothetical protein ACFL2A_05990 [Thermodesulfobacteriota bacterium]
MTAQEAKQVAREIRESNKKLAKQFSELSKADAKKLALKQLVDIGICTKKGNLRKPYRSTKKNV